MDELLKGLLAETNTRDEVRAALGLTLDFIDFDAELEELQADYELFEQCNGDPALFQAALTVEHTDEQLDEINRLMQEDREAEFLSPEFVDAIEQCMLAEELTMDLETWASARNFSITVTKLDHPMRLTELTTCVIPTIDIDALVATMNDIIGAVQWNLPAQDERKIMSSRTPSHEFLLEKRAENNLRRRNEGKRILSSRD